MGRFGRKKKDLNDEAASGSESAREQKASAFQSIFNKPGAQLESRQEPMFLPPESFGQGLGLGEDDMAIELSSASSWDLATRYHEFKARPSFQRVARRLRRISAEAVLARAQGVLGSVVHPVSRRLATWDELPGTADQPDIDLDETLESAPLAVAGAAEGGGGGAEVPITAQEIWMSYQVPQRHSVVLSVDTSLSMTGEKLALTAVALAVVLLQFPHDPIGVVAFENEARVLKRPDERISIRELVERFLDVPAQGYTHLEDGMRMALKLVRDLLPQGQSRPTSTVLLTDGKYTAGRDPAYLAPRFPHLVVMKMGAERASLDLCRELARKGKGALREVNDLEELPAAMYGVVKDLLRGRSAG